mmetsp:Transcript_15936/g.52536  ORF Transcript_15936/g.52536 Transcript_15936/m.52536 type:complete len:370 (-) Transcript_15936:262-1371(-)
MATQTITKSVTATDSEVAGLWTAYLLVVAMLVVPNFILIHPYLHLLILGPLLVWIGCQRALLEAQKAPGESNVEVVSKKDAMQFPLIGSCALFSLYLVVKFIKKEYIDLLISVYFAGLGTLGVFGAARPPVTRLLDPRGTLSQHKVDFNWKVWRSAPSEDDQITFSFSMLDVALALSCAAASAAYAVTKAWYLNNLLGCAFSIQGIEMLSLGSYAIGCTLLAGLFVYDVFWVFGTEVMVSVAKGLNAPIKVMFPKALGVTPMPFSMLGLGDIVIPGIFVAMMLRFDAKLALPSQPYFYTNFAAYVAGLGLTVGVMHFFDSAQPALLYLVPACILSSLLTAAVRGELSPLLKYSEEKPEAAAEADAKKEQ